MSIPSITSIKDTLNALENIAKHWQSDAYLTRAEIPIFQDSTYFVIQAIFESKQKVNEAINVVLYIDGDSYTHYFSIETAIRRDAPITDEDWTIDSQRALELLVLQLQQDNQNVYGYNCSSLILQREHSLPGSPVIWFLLLSDCGRGAMYYYIDATTGEEIHITR